MNIYDIARLAGVSTATVSRVMKHTGERQTMILDELAHIDRYRGLNPNLDTLIDWLGGHDCRELPLGRTDIDGDRVYANVQEVETRRVEDARFETHRHYLDVQVDLAGREAFRIGQGELTGRTAYDDTHDIDFCDAERFVEGDLDSGRFAIYLVGEAHMPNLAFPGDGVRQIKKICFKVLAE